MSILTFERKKTDQTDTYTASISLGPIQAIVNDYYIPVVIDDFVVPPITVSNVSALSAQPKLTNPNLKHFDNVRIGDTVSSGVVTAAMPTATIADVAVNENSKIVIYPNTYNSTNLPVRAGDAISGTSLANGTKVDRIDYINRIIYLTANATDTAIETLTVAPPVRVISKNPEGTEITLSANITTALTSGTVVFNSGTAEALLAILKVAPVGNTSNGNISIQVSAYRNQGQNVNSSTTGSGVDAPAGLGYVGLGNVTMDADEFLMDARVPRAN